VARRRVPESELKRLLGIKEAGVGKKAVVYVRVSSYDQKQKGDLGGQKQALLDYARSKG